MSDSATPHNAELRINREAAAVLVVLSEYFVADGVGRDTESVSVLLDCMARDVDRLAAAVPELGRALQSVRETEERLRRFNRSLSNMPAARRVALVERFEELLGEG